jgi:hypothetical protein
MVAENPVAALAVQKRRLEREFNSAVQQTLGQILGLYDINFHR